MTTDLADPRGNGSLTSPRLRVGIVLFVLLLFAITNLPWTLDEYDQAKQAYASFEMVEQGHWLYQHTPIEEIATKPPFVGWISAAIFTLTRSWETAWRLPSIVAALALLWVIAQESRAAYGASAGFVALSACGLNLLSVRLATLVRTDMPLALVIFLLGLQIWRKIRSGAGWNRSDQALTGALLTLAMLIKGPIVYAFILPGLIVYQILRRKSGAPSGWSGSWPWVLSFAIFLAWVIGGIVRQPGFYEAVVLKEFAGRFTETVHRPQPFYFYLPHLLQKFAPWSLLSIALAIAFWRKRKTSPTRLEPATLWLVCWSIGGLLVMSVIPSKRVDRIFPVIPPLCLLLGAQVAAAWQKEDLRARLRRWLPLTFIFACVFTGGYAAWKIGMSERQNAGALVRFSRAVRRDAENGRWRYEVVGGPEEGMLLYLRRDHFLAPKKAVRQWREGQLDAVVVRNNPGEPWPALLPGAKLERVSEKSAVVPQYSLFLRAPAQNHPRQPGLSR